MQLCLYHPRRQVQFLLRVSYQSTKQWNSSHGSRLGRLVMRRVKLLGTKRIMYVEGIARVLISIPTTDLGTVAIAWLVTVGTHTSKTVAKVYSIYLHIYNNFSINESKIMKHIFNEFLIYIMWQYVSSFIFFSIVCDCFWF